MWNIGEFKMKAQERKITQKMFFNQIKKVFISWDFYLLSFVPSLEKNMKCEIMILSFAIDVGYYYAAWVSDFDVFGFFLTNSTQMDT